MVGISFSFRLFLISCFSASSSSFLLFLATMISPKATSTNDKIETMRVRFPEERLSLFASERNEPDYS